MTTSYALQKPEQVKHMATTLSELVEKHGLVTVDYKVGRTRSKFQQAALEVWTWSLHLKVVLEVCI